MKTILTMLTGCLILTGCYTQFNAGSSSSGTRTPDFSKVETQVDESTKVTDYYDNSSYSWYLRNFNYGFGSRYYDRYGYDPYADYYSTYNTWGWGNRGYFDMDYDYIDYRIGLWHRRYPHYYNDWGYYYDQPVVYYYPADGNSGQNTARRGRRESRENVLVGANSTQGNMPVNVSNLGSPASSYRTLPPIENPKGRSGREDVLGGPVISQPGTGSSNSPSVSRSATSTTPSSGSTQRTGREDVLGGPTKSSVPSTTQPAPQQNSQPETKQASPQPAPSQVPSHRRTSRGRDN